MCSLYKKTVLFVAPSLVVQTFPSSIRILNVSPYNQFTVSCTASAEVNGQSVSLEMTMERRHSSWHSGGSVMFSLVPSNMTGFPEHTDQH